ncbi:RidA family protein [Bradyrhizobium sp. BWA-3-5]|uniref:RidA family protein n=1 Tax=Bradyrhizobium sp. BWA-3-5 TaxID=3080013 RepID=UPI00293EDDEB|nr:RidA family protein [Bradyrhizobium sp. BWA-3-5]WOH63742.1 RidA family protein [Bradyrhizobium sp. BWA-3-5]
MQIERFDSTPRRSRFTVVGNLIYLAGNTASKRPAAIDHQTREVLAKIDTELAQAGSDKRRILFVQIFLANIERDFDAMNSVWDAWTDPAAAPPRACVEAKMAKPDILVEMVVTATR